MVSDFIEEHGGYFVCPLKSLKQQELLILPFLMRHRKYGAREGYWTGEKFMKQIERAFKIAEYKYNPSMHTIVWLFDQSSCHRAFAPDAPNVNNMNAKPGGDA